LGISSVGSASRIVAVVGLALVTLGVGTLVAPLAPSAADPACAASSSTEVTSLPAAASDITTRLVAASTKKLHRRVGKSRVEVTTRVRVTTHLRYGATLTATACRDSSADGAVTVSSTRTILVTKSTIKQATRKAAAKRSRAAIGTAKRRAATTARAAALHAVRSAGLAAATTRAQIAAVRLLTNLTSSLNGGTESPGGQIYPPPTLAQIRAAVLVEVNNVRTAAAVGPVQSMDALNELAQGWADYLAATIHYPEQMQQSDHSGLGVGDSPALMSCIGDDLEYGSPGEDIGGPVLAVRWLTQVEDAQLIAQQMVDAWVSSPGHHRLLVADDATRIGVGAGLQSDADGVGDPGYFMVLQAWDDTPGTCSELL
jgi:uncharacterized protein YkwD